MNVLIWWWICSGIGVMVTGLGALVTQIETARNRRQWAISFMVACIVCFVLGSIYNIIPDLGPAR